MTDIEIKDLLEWGGVSVTADVGCFTGKVIDGLMWKRERYKNHDKLLNDFNFIKSLESKMESEISLHKREMYIDDNVNSSRGMDALYKINYISLTHFISGTGSTEREAIISALLNYRRGK